MAPVKPICLMATVFVYACGPSVRPPTTAALTAASGNGTHVTLPRWFEGQFPCAVRDDGRVTLHTANGDVPVRQFSCKTATGFASVQVTQSRNGWTTSKQNLLVEMIKADRAGKQLLAGKELAHGR